MKAFALLFLVGCYAGFSSAQVLGFGGCPDVQVVPDFDIERYYGVWYSIEDVYRTDSDGLSCISGEYQPADEGGIYVINSGLTQDGYIFTLEGTAFIPDPNVRAKLELRFNGRQTTGDYWVLDTDYESYALVHACSEYFFGWFNLQSNWILGRDRVMSEDAIRAARGKLTAQGINVQRLRRSDQTDCEVEPPRPSEMPKTNRPRPSEEPETEPPRPSEMPGTFRPRP